MIISCNKCNKKFDINSDLIPDIGRLLECGSCQHQFFFKKEILLKENEKDNFLSNDDIFSQKNENINNTNDQVSLPQINVTDEDKDPLSEDENLKKLEHDKIRIPKNANKNLFLNKIIVFIISFIALIILIDTFKYPISKIIPNIEFILYSLYESIKDMILFFKDLI